MYVPVADSVEVRKNRSREGEGGETPGLMFFSLQLLLLLYLTFGLSFACHSFI